LFQSALSQAVIGETTKEWRKNLITEKISVDSDLNELLRQIERSGRRDFRSEKTSGHEAITSALPQEWRRTSIGALFNLIDYRGKNPPRSEGGRRLITAKNIKMGYVSDEPIAFISEEAYKKWMIRGFPKLGDILFVTEGHTMGFVALNTRYDQFALAQRTINLQPAVPINTKFFFYFMLSSYFQELVRLNATGAAAVGMKASKFRSLPLPFPPIAEQLIIAAKLDALREETERLASLYTRKVEALGALKASLLHQAFVGKL
jgi:type I restriction enzyme S subunit